MITAEQLKGRYGEDDARAIYSELCKEGNLADFCREFMYDADCQVSRNALWTLTKATAEEHAVLQPMLHPLIDLAMQTGSSSVRRLALNNIERLRMDEDNLRTDFLDFCLYHMQNPEELPGIQSLCMKLACRMSKFYPELSGELVRIVEAMDMAYFKPAVRSVRNRILRGRL